MGKSIPTPRVRTSSTLDIKKFLFKEKHEKRHKKKTLSIPKRMYRIYSDRQRAHVLVLRYGSLQNFENKWHRPCEIARLLNMSPTTVFSMIE